MAGRGRTPVPDPDDWWSSSSFDAAPRPGAGARRVPRADEDVWSEDAPLTESSVPAWLGDSRRLVAVGALAVLLVAGLIVSGVFDGSHGRTAVSTPTTTTRPTSIPSTSAAPVARPPAATLSPGAAGPQVKVLQRALAALGFPSGTIDGSYGPATQRALARFQRAHHLAPDGVLGTKTLAALRLALQP